MIFFFFFFLTSQDTEPTSLILSVSFNHIVTKHYVNSMEHCVIFLDVLVYSHAEKLKCTQLGQWRKNKKGIRHKKGWLMNTSKLELEFKTKKTCQNNSHWFSSSSTCVLTKNWPKFLKFNLVSVFGINLDSILWPKECLRWLKSFVFCVTSKYTLIRWR